MRVIIGPGTNQFKRAKQDSRNSLDRRRLLVRAGRLNAHHDPPQVPLGRDGNAAAARCSGWFGLACYSGRNGPVKSGGNTTSCPPSRSTGTTAAGRRSLSSTRKFSTTSRRHLSAALRSDALRNRTSSGPSPT
jgi:hypothetical protein